MKLIVNKENPEETLNVFYLQTRVAKLIYCYANDLSAKRYADALQYLKDYCDKFDLALNVEVHPDCTISIEVATSKRFLDEDLIFHIKYKKGQ